MPDTECIHGLAAGVCDTCYPKVQPEKPAVVRRSAPRTTRAAGAPKVANPELQRVHIVVSFEELADALASDTLGEPNYFTSADDPTWIGKRLSPDALDQVVLVTSQAAIRETPVPFSAVQLVAVANNRAQARAREMISLTEYDPRVSVHPPWFTA